MHILRATLSKKTQLYIYKFTIWVLAFVEARVHLYACNCKWCQANQVISTTVTGQSISTSIIALCVTVYSIFPSLWEENSIWLTVIRIRCLVILSKIGDWRWNYKLWLIIFFLKCVIFQSYKETRPAAAPHGHRIEWKCFVCASMSPYNMYEPYTNYCIVLDDFNSNLYSAFPPVCAASPLCSSASNISNLTFPSPSIGQTLNVSDGSLSEMPANQKYFWCQIPFILIWVLFGSLLLVCPIVRREPVCERWLGGGVLCPDETPSGQSLYPANSHPSGSGHSPLIISHQRVPAHQHTPSGLPARWLPRLITD